MKQKKHKTHGELLRQLVAWSGGSQTAFAKKIGLTRKWVFLSMNEDRILEKNRIAICRAWEVPKEYWDGKYELPVKMPATKEYSEDGHYGKSKDELYMEIERLNGELVSAWKKIAELQENLYRKMNPESAPSK